MLTHNTYLTVELHKQRLQDAERDYRRRELLRQVGGPSLAGRLWARLRRQRRSSATAQGHTAARRPVLT